MKMFMNHVDYFLLGLFGLFVLIGLPRAIVRFSRAYELSNGYFLFKRRRAGPPPSRSQSRATSRQPAAGRGVFDPGSGISNKSTDALSGVVQRNAPTHVSRWSTLIHPLVPYVLNYRIAPGTSVGKAGVLVAYLAAVLYAGLYKGNPFSDSVRAGFVAMSQIPIVYALGTKNNVLAYVSGAGYEKVCPTHLTQSSLIEADDRAQLNYIHRVVGRIMCLAINVHALGFSESGALDGFPASC